MSREHVEALRGLVEALSEFADTGETSDGYDADAVDWEAVEPGGYVHSAVCAVQPHYGGRLPAPEARLQWWKLVRACRREGDKCEAMSAAGELLAWAEAEARRLEGAKAAEAAPVAASGRVKLWRPCDWPEVDGKRKPPLSTTQYDVVRALLEAGERGLSKDALDACSGHGDSRKVLRRLAASDSDWAKVIAFPGGPGRGYRVL